MTNKKRFIAVIGGSEPSIEEAQLAEAVGRELAKQGAIFYTLEQKKSDNPQIVRDKGQ